MSNIPGTSGYVSPNSFSRVRTIQRSVSIPGGLRITCIMGLGESEEVVVLSALGGGVDGVNPDYTGSNVPDGRHFELSKTNLVTGRTTVLLNDIPLSGFEDTIDTLAFDSTYDYRLESATGRIELQRASIRDQGGLLAKPGTSNVGNGFDIGNDGSTLELIDTNAPTETWTLRVTSVIRDAYGIPVSGNAVFNVVGSVSGTILDAYGAPVVFVSDGVERDNGILRAVIAEGTTDFDRGDRFTILIDSNVLVSGDNLTVRMIAAQDLNDPEFFTDANSLYIKHGEASAANTLSLGSQMAFENGAFGILALQAKPPVPRRTSEVLVAADNPLTVAVEGFPTLTTDPAVEDIDIFRHELASAPDLDTVVNIFITESDGTATQIFPTKVAFYSSAIGDGVANHWADFVDPSQSGYNYSYTVVLDDQVEDDGVDGAVVVGEYTFTAPSATFVQQRSPDQETGESDVGKEIRIEKYDRYGNVAPGSGGTYTITAVGDVTGDITVVTVTSAALVLSGGWAGSNSDLVWQLVDSADTSAYLLLTSDHWTTGPMSAGYGISTSYIAQEDADFYDNNWGAAFTALEAAACQIVVPLPNAAFSAIQQASRAHVELMSTTANQKERMTFIGAQPGVTPEALIGTELVAVEDIGVLEGIQGDDVEEVLASNIEDLQDFNVATNYGGSFRTVYFWPDQIVRNVSGTNTAIPGFYLGAAAAGYLSGRSKIQVPLTNKVLIGFSILRDKLLPATTLNSLGGNGVSVVQPVTGGGVVSHGKTTVSSGAAEEEEISIVFIRDRVATTMRAVMRRFIGAPQDATLPAAIASVALAALNSFVSEGILSSFRNLNVTRDEVDPRQYNIIVEVEPVYPNNWVFIDISLGLF